VTRFQGYLLDRGMVAIRRASKGQDISAACGQLKGKRSPVHNAAEDAAYDPHPQEKGNGK
jgi:23S rRNA (adenine2503-C2)-methyltransferase